MAPIFRFIIPSGAKMKEPRCVRLSEAKASHSHKMWTEVSSSVPHFLQVGFLLSPITWRCLLRVLCSVRRPITTLDFVLLRDNNRALVVRLGPEINYRACLCVLQGPHHNTKSWLSIQQFWQTNSLPCVIDVYQNIYCNLPLLRYATLRAVTKSLWETKFTIYI